MTLVKPPFLLAIKGSVKKNGVKKHEKDDWSNVHNAEETHDVNGEGNGIGARRKV